MQNDVEIDEANRESTKSNFGASECEKNDPVTFSLNKDKNKNNVIGNDMMAVARRIRERAQILQEEQKRADDTRAVLLGLLQKRDTEKSINDKQRKRLLQTINERNAVELEVLGIQESIEESRTKASAMKEETLASESRIHKLVEKRTEQTKSFYGPNLAKMETFVKVLETIVDSKEKAVASKRQRIEDLRTQLKESHEKAEEIIRETEETKEAMDREQRVSGRTGSDIDDDDDDEGSTKSESSNRSQHTSSPIGRDDQEITHLSKRVREAIEARSALRKKRNVVQKKYDKANEDMLFWQTKHIEKMTMTTMKNR